MSTANNPDEPKCHACGRQESQNTQVTEDEEPTVLNWCGGCVNVLYCSRQCQRSQWQHHKEECVARGSVLLGLAIQQGERKTVKRFARHKGCKHHLNHSSPIDGTPSWFQCFHPQESDLLDIILRGGWVDLEKTDKEGYTPLMILCAQELVDWETEILPFVKVILDRGVDLNKKGKHGETALSLAAYWVEVSDEPAVEIVKTLLESGADADIVYGGETLLQRHCETHYSENDDEHYGDVVKRKFALARVLIEAGANVNANPGRLGNPPLQIVAKRYGTHPTDIPMLEFLLSNGANVNAQDNAGCTALMAAAISSKRRGRTDMMESLLAAGADPNVKVHSELVLHFGGPNFAGHTAMTIAIDQIFKPAVEVLLQSRKVDFSVGGPDSQNLWRFVIAKVKTLKRQRSLGRNYRKDYDEMVQISRLIHSYVNENGIAV